MRTIQSIREAAYDLGKNGILNDPTDDEIILAAVEQAKGKWPENFSLDRYFIERVIEEYGKGEADRG